MFPRKLTFSVPLVCLLAIFTFQLVGAGTCLANQPDFKMGLGYYLFYEGKTHFLAWSPSKDWNDDLDSQQILEIPAGTRFFTHGLDLGLFPPLLLEMNFLLLDNYGQELMRLRPVFLPVPCCKEKTFELQFDFPHSEIKGDQFKEFILALTTGDRRAYLFRMVDPAKKPNMEEQIKKMAGVRISDLYNKLALIFLRNLALAMETHYAENAETYTDNIKLLPGFQENKDIVFSITLKKNDKDKVDAWKAEVKHLKGDKTFIWESDKGGLQ